MAKEKSTEEDIYKQIGAKVKQLRISKGFKSYEQFAIEFELNRMQYWRIESGANVTIKSLLKVLQAHNLSLEDFFKGIN